MKAVPLRSRHHTPWFRCSPRWLGVLSLSMSLFLLDGCSKHTPPAAVPEPTVAGEVLAFPGQKDPAGMRLSTVGGESSQSFTVPGRLTWDEDRTARVYAPYAGRVERLRAAVGDTVRRGQPLAELASADIGQAQADLQKAAAGMALANSALARARELAEGGVIAAKDLQQAVADHAQAQAESSRARARLAQYGVAGGGSVTQKLQLTAPVAGIVVERNGNPGAEVRTDVQGPPLFVISSPDALWVILDVDESQLAAFRTGDTVLLHSAAWPGMEFQAHITSVGASVDPTSRMVKVRGQVPNVDHRLKAEMFVTATVIKPVPLPVVPADAVFLRGETPYVFKKVGEGRFERHEVQLRSAGPESWMVLRGVVTGDQVVVGASLYFNQLMDAAK